MKKGKYLYGTAVVAVMLLWSAVYAGSALAEIDLGGQFDTNFVTLLDPDGEVSYNWMQHLNLDLLIPTEQNLSGKVEMDLYTNWNSQIGAAPLTMQLSKLYVKQRFEHFHLTVGRQPLSWSFGSLLNPVDYSVTPLTGIALDLDGAAKSHDGVVGYIPWGQTSDLSMAVTFPQQAHNAKFAARVRTQIGRFEVGVNCLRDVFPTPVVNGEGQVIGSTDQFKVRLASTAKGDFGPVGTYGAVGYVRNPENGSGDFLGMIGLDTSIPVGGESKLVAQLEYLYDQTELMQSSMAGPHLLVGTVNYQLDEFASVGVTSLVNPTDKSFLVAPMYKNQIGDGLDLTVTGAYLGGAENTQFGPTRLAGISSPRMLMQVGLLYTF